MDRARPGDDPRIHCSRCGHENSCESLFCQRCGLGLEVLAPRDGELLDAPVASFLLAGMLGGALGLCGASGLFLGALHLLKGTSELGRASALLSLLLWRGSPLLFALGASLSVLRRGRKSGLSVTWLGCFLGGLWPVGLGMALAPAAGEFAVGAGCVLSPLGAARFGFGLFRPWCSLQRAAGISLLALALALAAALFSLGGGGPVFVDADRHGVLAATGGTVFRVEGLQPPVSLGPLPEGAVGLAWLGGAVVATRSARLLTPWGRELARCGTGRLWSQVLRLGEELLILEQGGLLAMAASGDCGARRVLWAAERGPVLGMQPGGRGETVHAWLRDGRLLELVPDGTVRPLADAAPPLASGVALDLEARTSCAAVGRRVLCRKLAGGTWTESSEGLRVGAVAGFCSIEAGFLAATERGLYLGRGTPEAPFRRIAAGRFLQVQASPGGAVGVSSEALFRIAPSGRWRRYPLQQRVPDEDPGAATAGG